MIISSVDSPRRLFHTELPDGRWAVWTATADTADSIRIQRIRNPRSAAAGRWWADTGISAPPPRGMIAFRFDREPSLRYVRNQLPAEWSPLWDAVATEYADREGNSSECDLHQAGQTECRLHSDSVSE
jgi:hypothetical protein